VYEIASHKADVLAWVALEDSYVAVHAYPSRARDAAGRPGGIEKQVAYWTPEPSGVSAAAAAFCLLDLVHGFDDSVWWDSWDSPNWTRPEFLLSLGPQQSAPIQWDAGRLQGYIDRDIHDLQSVVQEDNLARFYQSVLDQHRPALLNVSAPLTHYGLAALLLPLPPVMAASVSLCNGLPTHDVRDVRKDRLQNWSGVVCSEKVVPNQTEPGDAARTLARALLAGDPIAINTGTSDFLELSPSAEYLSNFLASCDRNLADPPPNHDWLPIRPSEVATLIAEIRTLDAEADSSQPFSADPERQRARQRHLRLKGDLARAWLYACAPSKDLLNELPPREDALPPALWFGPIVPPSARLWERYERDDFVRLVDHGLKTDRRRERVTRWLEELKESGVLGS
jgi:hypothetical protein